MTPAKILVVDDEVELERLIRQRFRKQIKAREMDFLFVTNGREALNQLQADAQVDMVLTDINMPQMDGLTLLGQLSHIDQTLRAVVMSAYSDMPNIRKAMNRGAFDFLTKPLDFQDLERTIQKTLEFVQRTRRKHTCFQQTHQALLHIAYHDPLTGLPNRAKFMQQLTERIKRQRHAEQAPVQQPYPLYAVVFIDLDHFKLINDSFGHSAGDKLLKYVAHRLKGCLRKPDMLARLSGDEFAILLDAVEAGSEVTAVVARIQERLRAPFCLNGVKVVAQASIGIALDNGVYDEPEAALHDADLAMYAAKALRRGGFHFFDPTLRFSEVAAALAGKDLIPPLLKVEPQTEPDEPNCKEPG